MSELNITMKHGQSPGTAQANFEKAVLSAQREHPRWIHGVEWSGDRRSAVLSGPSYRVTLSLDDENLYARGTIPLALKLMERPIRRFVEETLERSKNESS